MGKKTKKNFINKYIQYIQTGSTNVQALRSTSFCYCCYSKIYFFFVYTTVNCSVSNGTVTANGLYSSIDRVLFAQSVHQNLNWSQYTWVWNNGTNVNLIFSLCLTLEYYSSFFTVLLYIYWHMITHSSSLELRVLWGGLPLDIMTCLQTALHNKPIWMS